MIYLVGAFEFVTNPCTVQCNILFLNCIVHNITSLSFICLNLYLSIYSIYRSTLFCSICLSEIMLFFSQGSLTVCDLISVAATPALFLSLLWSKESWCYWSIAQQHHQQQQYHYQPTYFPRYQLELGYLVTIDYAQYATYRFEIVNTSFFDRFLDFYFLLRFVFLI